MIKPSVVQGAVNVRELSGGASPIAMSTGYLRQYQSMVQVRQQVRIPSSVLDTLCTSPSVSLSLSGYCVADV